jgi:hypothetical protein
MGASLAPRHNGGADNQKNEAHDSHAANEKKKLDPKALRSGPQRGGGALDRVGGAHGTIRSGLAVDLQGLSGTKSNTPNADVILEKPVPERPFADAQFLGHTGQAHLVVELRQEALQGTPITLLDLSHETGFLAGHCVLRSGVSVRRGLNTVKRF